MKISGKWVLVGIYTVGIIILNPYLPQLIRTASSQWSSSSVSHFVLVMEVILALLILALGIRFLIYKKKKKALFPLICISSIILLSFVIYQFIPNPYEFTHLPEYAILGILMMRAMDKTKSRYSGKEQAKNMQRATVKNSYFLSGLITGVIGTGDELYQYLLPNRFFGWNDILLNILGGILGLLILWGTKR